MGKWLVFTVIFISAVVIALPSPVEPAAYNPHQPLNLMAYGRLTKPSRMLSSGQRVRLLALKT